MGSISESDARAMVRLLGEVAALDGGHAEKKRFLMDGLCQLVGADAWIWSMGCKRNPGEPQIWVGIQHGGFSDERFSRLLEALENPDMGPVMATFYAELERTGAQTTMLRSEIDPAGRACQPGLVEYWERAEVGPLILVSHPVGTDSQSGIGLYRRPDQPNYTPAEKQIAHIILQEVPWLHAAGWPDRGIVDLPKLYPRQRMVLNYLVEGHTRQEIADRMKISENTVSAYARDVYRHFGVNSQPELMKKFLAG